MKKLLVYTCISLVTMGTGLAQNQNNQSESASQSAILGLTNGIDISYVNTNTTTGNMATMPFTSTNDFANGVMSSSHQLRVRSNKKFSVAARCDEQTFSYQGTSSNITVSDLPHDALWMKVSQNNTGGSLSGSFLNNNFAALTSANQDIIVNGVQGGNQTFTVQYKCTPGFVLPAGTYNMDVVFTATQQ